MMDRRRGTPAALVGADARLRRLEVHYVLALHCAMAVLSHGPARYGPSGSCAFDPTCTVPVTSPQVHCHSVNVFYR